MTVRQAINELKTEGLVTSEHGRGVFVRAAPVSVGWLGAVRRPHRERGKAAFLVEAEKVGYAAGRRQHPRTGSPAPAEAAERLKIETGAPVVVRERRYLANGEPVEVATSGTYRSTSPEGRRSSRTTPGPVGSTRELEESGHPLDRFVELAARMPSPAERRALQLPPGVPVPDRRSQKAYDTGGVAVEVCDTVKAAYAYVLEYDIPAR